MKATDQWPAPIEIFNGKGRSPLVLLCEHASNHVPSEYAGLGLSPADLERHIAWDIGAAQVTRRLARLLDAPAFLGTYSRLIIDLNRPLRSPGSIVTRSEATDIPGNQRVSEMERERRASLVFTPFHDVVARHFDERQRAGYASTLVCIHSFTPVYHEKPRPWHAGVLHGAAAEYAQSIIARLREDKILHVEANVPYTVGPDDDYGLLVYGDSRRNPAALIEIRHDLIATESGVDEWAQRLAAALQ